MPPTPELKDKVLSYTSDVVSKIRVGRHPDNVVRVVLDLEDVDDYSVFNLYGRIPSLVNVYAAMPSMHVAWSIIAGALMISALRKHWWIWIVGVAHPILMAIAVVVTANHYVLDIVVGVAAR